MTCLRLVAESGGVNMKVYIVIGGYDYEGFSNLFVTTNYEKAQEQAQLERTNGYDYVEINEHEVEE